MRIHNDHDLGMDRKITRRDFLNGVGMTLTGAALATSDVPAYASALAQTQQEGVGSREYYPPTLTGLRGNHPGSFEVAHALARGQRWNDVTDTGERYDLVVVGAGISGLSSAYFFRNDAGRSARVLLLDNHDDFGGHAKRNEFHYNGHTMLINGGTSNLECIDQYSTVSRTLLKALGIDTAALKRYSDGTPDYFRSMKLDAATFFCKEAFGQDRLVKGPRGLADADYGDGGGGPGWATWLSKTPLSAVAQRDLVRLYDPNLPDLLPGLSAAEKKDRLMRMSYRDFLLNVAKVTPEVLPFLDRARNRLDVFAALAAYQEGHPGFQGMKFEPYPKIGPLTHIGGTQHGNEGDVVFGGGPSIEFPDGNATITRLLVRSMIPDALPGESMEDAISAHLNYKMLDRAGQSVRVRLNSTAINVRHIGDPGTAKEVEITYVRAGKAEKVRAQHVVLACYNMLIPYLVPELSAMQKEALAYCVKKPIVLTNICIRNWTAFEKLGVDMISCPGMYHTGMELGRVPIIGDYHGSRSPEDPTVVSLWAEPVGAGQSERDQYRTGRAKLLTTTFEDFERGVRDQMTRALAGGGFDAARDIVAITVNRWSHGYAYMYNMLFDKPEWALLDPDDKPCYVGKRQFGRISIANSDAAGSSHTDAAIDEAYRAAGEQMVVRFRNGEERVG